MGRIRVLPDHLANQIAAGEVVERPASALKELLENCFDAGSTEIKIFLEAGGKRRIRVEDNGCGMDRDDCLMALERHATSKLTRAEDLFSIQTLGFRGEALPSIASVSRFTLESRTRESDTGVRIEMHGSKMIKVEEVSRNPGTTITVDNLFFNIPARKKFLRTTETELSWMVNLITQYSIAHLDKHFYLEHNGKTVIDVPPVKELRERIYQHFGKKMLDHLVPFEFELDWLKGQGLASSPDYFKSTRSHQYLFVNGRMVKDRVLNHSISSAYEGFSEGRIFPVIFLFLEMPSKEVDVNVHPAKTEVKFIQRDFVHDNVRNGIRNALVSRKLTISYRFRESHHAFPSNAPIGKNDPWRKIGQQPSQQAPAPPPGYEPPKQDPWSRPQQPQQSLPGADPVDQSPLLSGQAEPGSPYERFLQKRDQGTGDAIQHQEGMNQQQAPVEGDKDPEKLHMFHEDPAMSIPNIIGQFRDSYILAEQEGDLLLIDQHVAHERILYDRICADLEAGEVERQALLVPITVDLSPQQKINLERMLPFVRKFGFDLDAFDGNTYVIREVPVSVQDQNLEQLVVELLDRAQGTRPDSLMEEIIDHFAATKACKAAVKINMRLTKEKMEHLLKELWASSSPLFCPHGRPIILRFSNLEIEKNFLRR